MQNQRGINQYVPRHFSVSRQLSSSQLALWCCNKVIKKSRANNLERDWELTWI